ncbi:MBL fold metallo-hydrolase [Actinoplanes sp. TBRC 11911]|uniref:MBL fold metallo-hydrolase n=1 Tax=Actinoplanes sp. TBRC 11911 TaxID=2729386 RepID=UPI00145D93D3|nr:MBL fold metallo-hydrolase [Actinoplanes sp. TBRC 11911]NMO57315.1 MBL fold metallo-hydrolase [Actinoplanes sp. TBRC 11911]
MRDYLLTRRKLLVAAGSGVLGVALVNTVTACSSDSPETPSAAPASQPEADLGGWTRVNMSFVSAYLLIRGDEAAVVDLGVANSSDQIAEGLKAAGSGWNKVKHVVITHLHPDHAGGLEGLTADAKPTFYAGEGDAASIISDREITPVKDGTDIFGLRVVNTPGHTLGHISIFDSSLGVLVAGDALRTTGGGLNGSDPANTADLAQAAESVRKLATLDVKAILPGHGAPLTSGAADALHKLASTIS